MRPDARRPVRRMLDSPFNIQDRGLGGLSRCGSSFFRGLRFGYYVEFVDYDSHKMILLRALRLPYVHIEQLSRLQHAGVFDVIGCCDRFPVVPLAYARGHVLQGGAGRCLDEQLGSRLGPARGHC